MIFKYEVDDVVWYRDSVWIVKYQRTDIEGKEAYGVEELSTGNTATVLVWEISLFVQMPDGTDICYHDDIQAKIGGYNGYEHYLVIDRSDGGHNEWSSVHNITEGFCGDQTEPPIEETEWYEVFVDNAGYFLLFVIAGVAINEIAK